MFKVNDNDTRTTSLTSFTRVFIVEFEQVNVSWKPSYFLHAKINPANK